MARMIIRVPVWDFDNYQVAAVLGDVCCGLETGSVVTVQEMESNKRWESLYLRDVIVSEIKDTPMLVLDKLGFKNGSEFRLFLAKTNHLARLPAEELVGIYVFADPDEELDFLEEPVEEFDDVGDIVRLFEYHNPMDLAIKENPGLGFVETTLDSNTTPYVKDTDDESDGV